MMTVLAAALVSSAVLNGIDVLERDGFGTLQGHSIGLITNHTGRTLDGRSTVDVLAQAPGVRLVALFAPEHGIRGEKDERIADGKDEKTGLPVYSLYNPGAGQNRYRPKPEQLKGIDTLVFDIQDVGARFYTYIGTLGYCMEEAARAGIRMVVLDRPNPIRGLKVDGPLADADKLTLTAYHPIPVQHGMTVGELASLYNAERQMGCKLEVVRMEGWRRSMWFDETGQTWVNPSPNMRSPIQALLYPGVCLLEASNVSVGRGTDTPFEVVGAPWMDGRRLAAALTAKGFKGLVFYPRRFTPTASKHAGVECGGVSIQVTDRNSVEAIRLGIEMAYEIHRAHPEWEEDKLVNLLQNSEASQAALTAGYAAAAAGWKADVERFERIRAKHLLYR